ncbi:hypothetical protein GCM10027418_16830 [Mariniluteicoccus endophyticus]
MPTDPWTRTWFALSLPTPWRIFYGALAAVGVLIPLALAVLVPHPVVLVVAAFAAAAQLLAFVPVFRRSLRVTEAGLEVCNGWRTHRLLWADVAIIERDPSWWAGGAARVVTTSGAALRVTATSWAYAIVHGEPVPPRAVVPTRALLVMQDAHRRQMR